MDHLFRVPPLDKTVLLTLSHSAQPPNSCKKTIHLTWLGTYEAASEYRSMSKIQVVNTDLVSSASLHPCSNIYFANV